MGPFGGIIRTLNALKNSSSPILKDLICNARSALSLSSSAEELSATKIATCQPITFIWGPPGTGKTENLANITLQFLKQGKRVLMLSYSNIAVDGAIMRVFSKASGISAGDIVRYGYPRDKDLLSHEYLTTFKLALSHHPELETERASLLSKLDSLSKSSAERKVVSERLTRIRKALRDDEINIVMNSQFVATTVSKATVDASIYTQQFDVVIFDEASMAYIPQIAFSASLAKQHFICIGDFCQLPPIVQTNDSTLCKDIFHYCYIPMAVEHKLKHQWLCLLGTQYRMHSQIANFVSHNMYYDLLTTADGVDSQRKTIVRGDPMPKTVAGLVDLSGFMSLCTQTKDLSHVNVLSAFVSCCLALRGAREFSVGIITPYSAQSRLINAMVKDLTDGNTDYEDISAATVHQFQGSEVDTVIFDAVDCYLSKHLGILLTLQKDNSANRLFNVAMTRAKGKFLAVVNYNFMTRKNLPQSLLFAKLLSSESREFLRGEDLLRELAQINTSCIKVYSEQQSDADFLSDIASATKEISITIPEGTSASPYFIDQLALQLSKALSRSVNVCIRTDKKSGLPQKLQPFATKIYNITNPITVIDNKLIWFGKPDSNANFIAEGRTIITRYRPVIRMVGKRTAKQLRYLSAAYKNRYGF